jgi:hypothetical protein
VVKLALTALTSSAATVVAALPQVQLTINSDSSRPQSEI